MSKKRGRYKYWDERFGTAAAPEIYLPLLHKAKKQYQYERTTYWYPLERANRLIEDFPRFFIMDFYIDEMRPQVLEEMFQYHEFLFLSPLYCIHPHVYQVTREQYESNPDLPNEYALLPPRCNWIFYCGHEGTLAFAGKIYDKMREITRPRQHLWNVYHGG